MVGEWDFAVRHAMLANASVKILDLNIVRSQYMELGKCDQCIQEHGFLPETAYNTAGSAKFLHKVVAKDVGEVSRVVAAETYHLNIFQEDIRNSQQNVTRFLTLGLGKVPYEYGIEFKTSVGFCLENLRGGLWKELLVLASLNIKFPRLKVSIFVPWVKRLVPQFIWTLLKSGGVTASMQMSNAMHMRSL